MDTPLRPMSTSQVLDRTFQLYRRNFGLLAGIGALLPALLLVLQLAFVPFGFPPRNPSSFNSPAFLGIVFLFYGSYIIVSAIGNALAGGATVYCVAKLHLGQNVTIGESYKQVFSRFWTILGIIFIVFFACGAAAVVGEVVALIPTGFVIGSTRTLAGSSAGGIIAIVAVIIFAIAALAAGVFFAVLLYCKWSFAVPACVLEHRSAGSSLGRSWSLTKGAALRVFLVYLLMAVLSIALALAFAVPSQIYTLVTHGRSFLVGVLIQEVGAFIAGVLAHPIATTAVALIYYDQRVRKEAFDLQLMMDAIGQQAPPQPSPSVAIG